MAYGNKCGHSWKTPRIPKVQNVKKPPFLTKVQDHLCEYYDNPTQYLPRLRYTNGTKRQRKSERREAHTSAPHVLLDYLDLDTLSVTMKQSYLADCTSFGEKRLYRALKDFQDAGYIRRFSKCVKEKGEFVTYRKIKFHPSFFHDLKIDRHELLRNQDLKRKSLSKQVVAKRIETQSPEDKAQRAANQCRLANLIRDAIKGPKKPKKEESPIAKRVLPPATGDPPQILSRHRLVSTTTQAERENHADRRLAYFQQLRETLSFEEAKAKADEKFPPLA